MVHCLFKKVPFWNPYHKITMWWQFRGLPCATTVATGTRLSLLLPGTACRWTGISLQLPPPARHDICPVSFTFNWVNSTPDNTGLSSTSIVRAVGKNLWMKMHDFTVKLHLQTAVQCHEFLLPLFQFMYFYNLRRGTQWRSWLRHCATSQKVAGSIPNGIIGIFHWHNPSGHTMALGLTQPLTKMSTRNISWG